MFTQFTNQNEIIRFTLRILTPTKIPVLPVPPAGSLVLIYVSFLYFLVQIYDQMYDLICYLLFYTKGYVHICIKSLSSSYLAGPVGLKWGKGDRGDHHIPESPATETSWALKAWEGVRTRVIVAVSVCSLHL